VSALIHDWVEEDTRIAFDRGACVFPRPKLPLVYRELLDNGEAVSLLEITFTRHPR
jgi:hypothetical protein